jgi:mannose/fructose-specific phosphotransferase system component IIA
MLRETSYDSSEMGQYVDQYEPLLAPDQYNVYKSVLHTIDNRNGGLIFLDAPGGTVKTFLINLLQAKVRQTCKIALAVAASGIAATLLTNGRTTHSANYISTWHTVKLQHAT